MTTISIEGGTTHLGGNLYRYEYGTVDGRMAVLFTAPRKPKIGDKVVDGVWEALVGYKINGDVSRWLPEDFDTWPNLK